MTAPNPQIPPGYDAEAAEWQFAARLQTEYYEWRLLMGLEPMLTHLELLARCEMICKTAGCLTDEKWCRIYGALT